MSDLEVTNTELVSFRSLEDSDIEQAQFIFETIDTYVSRYLKNKIDYGLIPGCGSKKVLFKPGAEKLCRLFKLRPTFELVGSASAAASSTHY
jgi:hypothetical protein